MARTLERAQATYDANMYGSYIEGRTEGKEEKAIEIAKSMLADGLGHETVAKYTGLTVEQVKPLDVSK